MHVVTGAFGYIGKYITRRLVEKGEQVKTITTHPDKPNPFGTSVTAHPYDFNHPEQLIDVLQGATTLFNTYWIRFPYAGQTFESALKNTQTLLECARAAGIKKVIHISVTQASEQSNLPYYRGKALQERYLRESGLGYAIIRPTLVFGQEDILVNNIAWLLRKFPVFPVFGDGMYRVQPVFVGDLAEIAVDQACNPENATLDAIGPETYTFTNLVSLIARQINRKNVLVMTPPALGIAAGRMIGKVLKDVILTQDELDGLMQSLLTSPEPPNGSTHFSSWLKENQSTIGSHYSSELQRHFFWSRHG
jgi:NADH dehydrogenase